MYQTSNSVRKGIATFLAITFALSSVFYFLIIWTGRLGAGRGLYVTGLMWCPGLAALLTCRLRRRSVSGLGWKWDSRYQLLSYLIPLAYASVAYIAVWLTGLGRFPNGDFVKATAGEFGWEKLPAGLVITFYVLMAGTVGMVTNTASALGEEIGWRGFLVPELSKVTTYTKTALISGIIWSVWHYPVLLFADYNSGTPAWYGLTCFTVMVIGLSFAFAWLRLKSGSLWTGAFLHASHNLFIQAIFTPITADMGVTKYVIDEFGAALAVVALIVAFIFWRRRSEVSGAQPSMPRESLAQSEPLATDAAQQRI